MKPGAIGLLLAGVLLVGCNKPAPGQPATAGESTSAPKHDPNDFSSLRTYPLKDLVQSEVTVNGTKIPVWVMDTEGKRAEGYMYLRPEDAPDGHGMIFMFPSVQPGDKDHGFWMLNCLLELDIAFISPDKHVLNVVRGKKLDKTQLPAAGPYKYVLELKAGEAAKFGVVKGVKVDIPSDLETKQ